MTYDLTLYLDVEHSAANLADSFQAAGSTVLERQTGGWSMTRDARKGITYLAYGPVALDGLGDRVVPDNVAPEMPAAILRVSLAVNDSHPFGIRHAVSVTRTVAAVLGGLVVDEQDGSVWVAPTRVAPPTSTMTLTELPRHIQARGPHPALVGTLSDRRGRVHLLALDASGERLAAYGAGTGIGIWDWRAPRELVQVPEPKEYAGDVRVRHLALAPDASFVVLTGPDHRTRVWDLPSGAERFAVAGHRSTLTDVAVAPDSTWLVTSGADKSARIIDAATGDLRKRLGRHKGSVERVCISPRGDWVATASRDGTARLWSPAGQPLQVLSGHERGVALMAPGPDGSWLLTIDVGTRLSPSSVLRIWDVADGTVEHELADVHPVVCVAPQGEWYAVVVAGGVALVELASGTSRLIEATGPPISDLVVAPGGSWLAGSRSDGTVCIWDVGSGALRSVLRMTERIGQDLLAPDSATLISHGDGDVQRWDATQVGDATELAPLAPELGKVTMLTVSPDGSQIATDGPDDDGMRSTVRLWNTGTGAVSRTLPAAGYVRQIGFWPDGSRLAVIRGSAELDLWDPRTGELLSTVTEAGHGIGPFAVAPDGSWFALNTGNKSVQIRDTATGAIRHVLRHPWKDTRSLLITPDGASLVTGCNDAIVRVWDPVSGELRYDLPRPADEEVPSTAISPDSRLLVTNDGTQLWVRDLASGEVREQMPHHAEGGLLFAPDWSWLALVTPDAGIEILDPHTWSRQHLLRGHRQPITWAAANPSGTLLAALSQGELRIWRPATGEHVAVVESDAIDCPCTWYADDRVACGGPETLLRFALT